MEFAREKRLLLGLLALLVAIPLPLNEPRPMGVVPWSSLVLYTAAVLVFLARVRRELKVALPAWALNLLGLLYCPWFFFELRTIGPIHLARPMVNLLLFGLVVKLFSLRREKDKWHVAILLFFVFVAAIGPSISIFTVSSG